MSEKVLKRPLQKSPKSNTSTKVSKIVAKIIKKNAVLWIRHFGTDPDQRIRNTELRIRILLFVNSSQVLTKNKFFNKFFCLILFEGTFTSGSKDKKSKRSSDNDGSGSGRLKNIRILRIRIHNTGKNYKGPTFFAEN
jgi:hypothetical protein